ncbi:MAG: V-type ATPase subunit [bacterium]|nr:V-type ATPase subunit [bacterium]
MDIYFLSGKINSLEKKFVDYEKIKKILASKTFEEYVNIMEDTFFKIPIHITSPEEILNFFEHERIKLYEEIKKIQDEQINIFFFLKYDYHNLSILLLKKETFSLYGIINFYDLKYAFEKNEIRKIPYFLKEGFEICKSKRSLEEILLGLKNNYYKKIYEIAQNISDYIKNYIKIEIDFENIKTYLNKRLNEERLSINDFASFGFIKKEYFLNDEELWKAIKTNYKGINTTLGEINIEDERYKILIEYLKEGRVKPDGIDKILSFYLAREIEILNLQRITIAKFYKKDESFLKNIILPPFQYKKGIF